MGDRETHDGIRPDDEAAREETVELDSAGVYLISVEDFERRNPPRPEGEAKASAAARTKRGGGG